MVRRAGGSRERAAGAGAQLRPRSRARAQGQLLGDGAQAPQGEEADEVTSGPGGADASRGKAQLVTLSIEVAEAPLPPPVKRPEVDESEFLRHAPARVVFAAGP